MAEYVLFQRTAYLRYENYILYKILKKVGLNSGYKSWVRLESLIRSKSIGIEYHEDTLKEFKTFVEYLPENVSNTLDIGCGIGAINVMIFDHYKHQSPNIHLLDKTSVDEKIHYFLEKSASFYNSLELSKKFLSNEGVPQKLIHLHEVDGSLPQGSYDIILSLISWGFHYPISVYLEDSYDKLKDGGVLILDVRKESDGLNELNKRFKSKIIYEGFNYVRVLCKK